MNKALEGCGLAFAGRRRQQLPRKQEIKMKFNTTQFLKPTTPRAARPNESWTIEIAKLDVGIAGLYAMIVIDSQTRIPLSATLSLMIDEDMAATLDRLGRRSRFPDMIQVDHGFNLSAVRAWAIRHRLTIVCHADPRKKALAEPILRDLSAFLSGKSFPKLIELGNDLERWRHAHAAGARHLPSSNG
ncbi:hypothetical protein [Bradyrhizobium canariense]|uniref:hypothetical protein n=1 Tax=Bradyrhizobium canariense TaxID=255045 RepID=UPI000A197209|nr:hypothetical protein [Bradyrhizobium canariense]OSI24884.1 hypothetical protein BST65_17130 [Bradyrhizobium canariense]OSI34267.1 hypothetical protein BST66_10840 [Bradyrhizobium canariense]OSI45744.1 hypothetical protein BSZ20_12070 [Bradyrhizobium canariense]OSI48558.1 hypothetical protein BST67_17960 [Bradyrhizobium canariense]OSI53604.1 hypothetical protein BSZ15_25045 [Bradyrhizobium canariense]